MQQKILLFAKPTFSFLRICYLTIYTLVRLEYRSNLGYDGRHIDEGVAERITSAAC
jgi:hypothetical protein